MQYMTIAEASEKWGICPRRIQVLCCEGRIKGASRFGGKMWAIPTDAKKPPDLRVKSGRYCKTSGTGRITDKG